MKRGFFFWKGGTLDRHQLRSFKKEYWRDIEGGGGRPLARPPGGWGEYLQGIARGSLTKQSQAMAILGCSAPVFGS